jgi:hypothetical protein
VGVALFFSLLTNLFVDDKSSTLGLVAVASLSAPFLCLLCFPFGSRAHHTCYLCGLGGGPCVFFLGAHFFWRVCLRWRVRAASDPLLLSLFIGGKKGIGRSSRSRAGLAVRPLLPSPPRGPKASGRCAFFGPPSLCALPAERHKSHFFQKFFRGGGGKRTNQREKKRQQGSKRTNDGRQSRLCL